MGSSSPDTERSTRVSEQEALAELSQQALDTDDLDRLVDDAAATVTETLRAEYCAVLEVTPSGDAAVFGAGLGWRSDLRGTTVPTTEDTQIGAPLRADGAVIVDGISTEPRLSVPEFLLEHDVTSGIGVRIGPSDDPWGVLGVYTSEQRTFTESDAAFLRSVTNVLASAIERVRTRTELEEPYGRISDAFFAIDEEWQFTHLNERARALLSPDGRQLVGTNVWDAFPEAIGRKFKPKYERAMAEQETVSFEEYYPEPLDAWFEVHAYPSPTGLSVYFRDISERGERERELRRKERRFEAVFEDPNILVGLLDPDGTVRDINRTALEYIDSDLSAVTDIPFWETPWWRSDDDIRSDVREWVERAAAGEYVDFEADLTRPSGERYTIEGVFRPVTDEDGEVVSIIVSDRDVTERKAHERALEERERQLSTLMDNVPGMVYRCRNARGWPMEFVSDACADVTGYEPTALERGEVVWGEDVVVEADREMVWETVQQDAADGGTFSTTYRIETADGDRRWVRDYGRGILEDGDLVAVEGIIADVTERKRLAAELEESERRYRTLVEQFPNGAVALVDRNLRYRTVGGNPLDVADVTADEIEGKPVEQAIPSALADELVPRYEAALEGESSTFETELNGRVYRFHVVPVRNDDGNVSAALGMSQDITERTERKRRLERSEQRYRTLTEHFPNGIVTLFDHELRYELAAGRAFDDIPVEPETLEGRYFREVWDEETADALQPAFEAALDGRERSIELEYAGREWVFHAVPITDERGDVFAGMTMAQDITERKEYERYLRDAKSQLEAATEAGAVGTWEWDVQTDEMVVGQSFARTFGVEPAAAREGVSLDRFISAIHEADRERVVAEIEAAVESGGDYEAEYRVRNADGEIRWVVARGRVECDADGTPVTFPGALTDITERKRAELQLQRNNEQLETLFEILPVGVVVADADGRLVEANDTATEIWGGDVFDAESIAEYEQYPAVWADSGEPVEPEEWTMARVLEGEEVTDPDVFEIETVDGKRRIIQVEGMPVRDETGTVTRGVVTITDITERRNNQRKLAESEQRYRTLVEHFPNGAVGLFDDDLRYQVVGGAAFDDIETTTSSIVGKTVRERYPEPLADQLEPKFRAALEGEANAFEIAFHGRDWMAYTVPVTDDGGEIFGGMILVQDVTEQKERERKLRERERRLKRYKEYTDDVLDAIDDVFYVIDEEGTIQRWNRSLNEVTGYTDAEIDSMNPAAFFDDDDWETVVAAVREGFETGSVTVELELHPKDGEPIPVEFAASTLEDPWGNTVLAGIGRDVTERVERQRALEESERRYRTLTQHFPNGAVGVYDHDLTYTLTEGAELGETLPPADRLEGNRLPAVFPEETVADLEPLFRAAVEDGETGSVETTFAGRDWRVWATPLRDADGDIFAGLSFTQDVTERREYERKLEESNERLEQFAYAASHDLQEPLRMITSYLQLLESRYGDAFDEDGEEFLAFAIDGADRMRDMIDGLLEYSRVETRGEPFEPVDLNAVFESVLADLQFRIEESNAEITAAQLPRVTGDRSQIRQVLQNLVSNAITYSGDEPPRVHVGAERRGSEWVISVRDEGIGIDPADHERVFSIFDRLHSHAEYDGTGIGLALCERIVERHGGEIWVESEPGEGSTFSITLPAA
ncbi:PAS domain-containing protein [Halopiger djelfimassiliensis]|uniref:PAS domain-containing protein n=1 Tax=Halopiger djelfimassiliensis TaxID=1293047 RepID=UPI00067776D8|nr:PAS domain-containing protein [Halopiger djelfimassiliensis]